MTTHNNYTAKEENERQAHETDFSLLTFAVGLTCRVKPIHTEKQIKA